VARRSLRLTVQRCNLDPEGEMPETPRRQRAMERQRWEILRRVEEWLETPMVVLGLVWIILLVAELAWGISPLMQTVSYAIWIAFIVDFALRMTLAPAKWSYLKNNWLTGIALVLPGLRVLRAARALRALRVVRGIRLVRIVASLNRGMRALGSAMGRRGFGYVLAMTTLVLIAGAAGMLAFERSPGDQQIGSYGEALWWTAMLLTTIGSEYWPQSPEGRMLALLLAVYSLGVLGYITAALASFFVERDAAGPDTEVAGEGSIRELRAEIELLRHDVQKLTIGLKPGG
jgi:voltage-gated potassium channel